MRNIFVEETDPRELEEDVLSELVDDIVAARRRRESLQQSARSDMHSQNNRGRAIRYSRTFDAPPVPRHRRQLSL